MNELWTPGQREPCSLETMGPPALVIPSAATSPGILAIADERVITDLEQRTVTVDGQLTHFSPTEFDTLSLMSANADSLVTRAQLAERLWDVEEYDKDRNVYNLISVTLNNVRSNLGEELGDTKDGAIRTRHRLGYMAVSSLEGSVVREDEEELATYLIADERIMVDLENQQAVCDGRVVQITPRLFKLLTYLAREPYRVASIEELSIATWGSYDSNMDNGVRVGVSSLRKVFGPELGNPSTGAIRTRFGSGYYSVEKL